MNEYLTEWLEIYKSTPKDGVLEALTILALKNTTPEYEKKFFQILNYLENTNPEEKFLVKLKQIFKLYKDYEVQTLKNLNFINNTLNKYLQSPQSYKDPVELKKWWE